MISACLFDGSRKKKEKENDEESYVMNIGYILFFALEVLAGALSSLYLFVSLFFVIGQKIYRKVKYGASLYD